MGGLADRLLVCRRQALEPGQVHQQQRRRAQMPVFGVVGRHLIVAGGQVADIVVLGAVDDAGLQRGIDFAIVHRRCRRTQQLDHAGRYRRRLDPDPEARQILDAGDGVGLARVEVAGAGFHVVEADQAIVRQVRQHLLADVAVQDRVFVVEVAEDVGQREHAHGRADIGQHHGVNAGEVDDAELRLLDRLRLLTELGAGVDFDPHLAVGVLGHQLGKAVHRDRDRIALRLVLGQAQHGLRSGLGCRQGEAGDQRDSSSTGGESGHLTPFQSSWLGPGPPALSRRQSGVSPTAQQPVNVFLTV